MRIKALYLASFMSDVVKPYIEQTNDVTPGISTSMDVSDRKAVTCQSDMYLSRAAGMALTSPF